MALSILWFRSGIFESAQIRRQSRYYVSHQVRLALKKFCKKSELIMHVEHEFRARRDPSHFKDPWEFFSHDRTVKHISSIPTPEWSHSRVLLYYNDDSIEWTKAFLIYITRYFEVSLTTVMRDVCRATWQFILRIWASCLLTTPQTQRQVVV